MSTIAYCPNPSCGRLSHLGDDPLGRIFRCPRCLTKLRAGESAASDSGWTVAATPPRRARAASRSFSAVPRGAGFGSGFGSGGVAVLAPPAPPAARVSSESGEFLAGAFDPGDDFDEPWDDLAEAASGFGWNESSYSVPAVGQADASRTGAFAAPRRLERGLERRASAAGDERGLARFRIMSLLGEGRHATVYRAFDPTLERQVALKLMRDEAPRSSRAQERFLGEARALARLKHPGIVSIFEAGRDGDRLYLALDLIEGRGLSDVLAEGRLSHRRGAEIVADLAEALAYAHGLGIVHRDVKPANVRIDARGGVHLMDFGIAHRPDSPDAASATTSASGAIVGTPAYLAPEQLAGERREALPASDQYSLGAVLYELLCGRPPFDGPASSVLARTAAHEPPCPTAVDLRVPRPLAEICRRATAKKPERRYASCQDLAADLRRWLRGERPQGRRLGWFA
ncbi:serine/threonine-protein kinase [Planctomyces sp. SH-PL62]|uniref:serine/threonine-protein kinase n=1 Tax=Planctomyces sp. SH-PL62 TaxID=1636152 RepID=UPI00078B92D7|nr:serine/threonine-protein kinase [Planctomyces sp. SH-PL62]AMV37831.1 Serine/threonine-protein kinase PrkC [Planctomyces sp. SH-PL62]